MPGECLKCCTTSGTRGKKHTKELHGQHSLHSEHEVTEKQSPRKVRNHFETNKQQKYSKLATASNFLIKVQ